MVVTPTEAGIMLTFSADDYERFNTNVGLLRFDVSGFQEWHYHKGEHEKVNAFEHSQNLIDIFVRLLGNKIILNS
jgi:hypothetical protein